MLKSIHLVVLKLINEKHKFMNLKKQIKKGSIILLLSMFHVMTFAQTRQVTGVVNDTYGDRRNSEGGRDYQRLYN